jgi:HK97 gp10 family phage protein
MTVNIIDRGFSRIINDLKQLENTAVKVGFPKNGEVGKRDNPSKLEQYSNISEVASVAIFQEFGTRNIPDRPFMRPFFTENKAELLTLKSKLYKKVVKNEISVKQFYNLLGLFAKSKIQKKIVDIRTPVNSAKTVKIKGFDNPLIWTGQMKNSVQHEIVSV